MSQILTEVLWTLLQLPGSINRDLKRNIGYSRILYSGCFFPFSNNAEHRLGTTILTIMSPYCANTIPTYPAPPFTSIVIQLGPKILLNLSHYAYGVSCFGNHHVNKTWIYIFDHRAIKIFSGLNRSFAFQTSSTETWTTFTTAKHVLKFRVRLL